MNPVIAGDEFRKLYVVGENKPPTIHEHLLRFILSEQCLLERINSGRPAPRCCQDSVRPAPPLLSGFAQARPPAAVGILSGPPPAVIGIRAGPPPAVIGIRAGPPPAVVGIRAGIINYLQIICTQKVLNR